MQLGILSFGRKMTNIGDMAQKLGVVHAFQEMGIDVDNLTRIYAYEGNSLKEDTAFLMSGYFDSYYGFSMFPMDKKMFPFYLGFHCVDEKRIQELIKEKQKPLFIGCRDFASYKILKRDLEPDIPVFMSGCYSLLQDKRKRTPENGKIMLVDVEDGLYQYIPKEYMERSEKHSHIHAVFAEDNEEADQKAIKYVSQWFDYLREEAELVITSRLHCALPCIAMGIPVIVARKYEDDTERYSGYEKLFHVYMPDEYGKINWKPSVPDIEWLKNRIYVNTKKLIELILNGKIYNQMTVKEYVKDWDDVHTWFVSGAYNPYYEGKFAGYLSHRQKRHYLIHNEEYESIISYITGKKISELNLAIWGSGDKAKHMLHRYEQEIKKFKGCCFVDSDTAKQGRKMFEFDIYPPGILKGRQNEMLVIVAVNTYYEKNGREISACLENEYGYHEGIDFLMLDKLDSSARYELEDFVLPVPLM